MQFDIFLRLVKYLEIKLKFNNYILTDVYKMGYYMMFCKS